MSWLMLVAPLLITGAVLFLAPNITPRYSLFGVRVDPGFRSSRPARRALFRFRLVVGLAIFAMAALIAGEPGWVAGVIGGPLVVMAAAISAWIWQYRALRAFGLSRSAVLRQTAERRVQLSAAPDRLPGWFWLGLAPFVILGSLGLYLAENWSRIPERFPVHWGIDGQPDAIAARTPQVVFAPLILCAVINAWIIVLALVIWYGSRRSAYRTGTIQLLVIAEAVMTVIASLIAIAPVWHLGASVFAPVILGLIAGLVGLAIWRAGQINAERTAADDQTDPGCWHGGFVYFDPKDPAIAVPKRSGFGFTLNLARPGAWLLAVGSAITIAVYILWTR
jgi:uncharacterized membrane protein